jgi:zinc/manganese transport system permease protein
VTYFWSLGFTIIGAAVFAFTRVHGETRIPQEAIIGIAYAVSAAAAILAMSKAPEGTEHLKDMLVGNILTVSKHTVAETAALYAAVGIFHYIFRKKFLAISLGEQIPRIKLWDFLFYTSFGFVVTSSVAIAGVLLVFSYLIVPSVAAMLFARSIGKRLAIGWTMGAVVSAIGIMISFQADLPTGATIVCTFGIALLLLAVIWRMTRRPGTALAN